MILALVMIVVAVGAVSYEYYQSQKQPQLQQNPISILKQFGAYDGNYSYVMFGSADTNSILSSNQNTATYTYPMYGTGTFSETTTATATYVTSEIAYQANEVTHSGIFQNESFTYTNYLSTASIGYSVSANGNNTFVDFSGGPTCRWQQFGNGPHSWSGCKQFVLMIYNTEQKLPLTPYPTYYYYPTPGASSGYLVVNQQGLFFRTLLECNGRSIDWQFYFFYATYTGPEV